MELGVVRLTVHCNTFAENQLQRIPIDPLWGISLSRASYYGIGDRDSILVGPRLFLKLPRSNRTLCSCFHYPTDTESHLP
jgi:hypothetical protein